MNLIGIEIDICSDCRRNKGCYNWTLLELKLALEYVEQVDWRVIIEPYWNWNTVVILVISLISRYNWTLLELKCKIERPAPNFLIGYNWTLLELKLLLFIFYYFPVYVIIEPYWNWNNIHSVEAIDEASYNWTLLELKWCPIFRLRTTRGGIIEPYWNWNEDVKNVIRIKARYNWTLLELKLMHLFFCSAYAIVIIEPYWNWNSGLVD